MTLTIPNSVNANEGAKELISGFRRLRQRRWFGNRCKGGAWVIEVTGTPGRWHVHLHVLLESRFLPHDMLSREWGRVSSGRIVHIKAIPASAIISYVTTYVSKSKVSKSDQVQLSSDLKNLRLFQPFGTWHAIALTVPKVKYCCPKCDYEGFYLNGLDYSPESYGARAPPGTLERSLSDKIIRKCPLPPPNFKNGCFQTSSKV